MAVITISSKLQLPKTGQTTSYVDYDDGYYEKGSPITPRFIDNSDGTVTDRLTNLMWVQCPDLIIPGESGQHSILKNQIQSARGDWAGTTEYTAGDLVAESGHYYVCVVTHTSGTFATDLANGKWVETTWTSSADPTAVAATFLWAAGITQCEGLSYAGYSDWYLPNVNQMVSLCKFEGYGAIDTTYFPTIVSDAYLTSTTYYIDTLRYWAFDVVTGVTVNGYIKDANDKYILPVRNI